MLNDPQPPDKERHPLYDEPRKRHPLEEQPTPPPSPQRPEQPRITLSIPLVPPRMTYLLIAINVVVFALGMLSPDLDNQMFAQGASRSYEVLVLGQYYRLLTAMFLHGGVIHILFNMYALYIIGRGIEPVFGSARFIIIYLLGGLTGSILSVGLGNPSPIQGVASVGASGAVFALFAAEMVYLYRHRQLMGQRATQQLRSLLYLLAINLFIGLASWTQASQVRIDNWAHIGGFVGGLAVTWLIGPIYSAERDPMQPHRLVAEDHNPLPRNYSKVSLYGIALVGILAFFSLQVR